MAKNQGNGKAKEAAKESKEKRSRGDWDQVTSDRNAPWLKKAEGKSLEGELLGRFSMTLKGQLKYFYQLKVTDPGGMEAARKDEDAEPLAKGDVVSFGEFAAVRDLKQLSEDGGKYLVAIDFIELVDNGDGTERWNAKVFKRQLSPPTRAVAPSAPPPRRDAGADDDMPF